MTEPLQRYYQRAPRFILRPQENSFIRFAGPRRDPWEEDTQIKNISMSGLIFSAPVDIAPEIGEMIKVQFEVPGASQMACWARVQRINAVSNEKVMIAIQFEKLELAHKLLLKYGLNQKKKNDEKLNRREKLMSLPLWIAHNSSSVFKLLFISSALAVLWYFMNYWI